MQRFREKSHLFREQPPPRGAPLQEGIHLAQLLREPRQRGAVAALVARALLLVLLVLVVRTGRGVGVLVNDALALARGAGAEQRVLPATAAAAGVEGPDVRLE